MATILYLHAHPDDEATLTSGSMARASADGHQVLVAFATGGELGEVPADLAPGETLVDRRRAEAVAAAAVMGVSDVRWLGYTDSGMTGWEQNAHASSFAQADVDVAAAQVAAIIDEVGAALVVGYDWHGNYGHPDHIRVHRVVRRAVELATRRPVLIEATTNRDVTRALVQMGREMGMEAGDDWDPDNPMDDGNPLGMPEAEIHLQVDVSDLLGTRRQVMECYRSQATDVEGFLAMPPEVFGAFFGTEHYVVPGHPGPMTRGWIADLLT